MRGCADELGLSPRTLRRWTAEAREESPAIAPRGRPPKRASRDEREQVLLALALLGPRTGIPTLRREFPGIARAELERVQAWWRGVCRKKLKTTVHVLTWRRAGAVWASDFKHAPEPIDGLYGKIVASRDLGGRYQIGGIPALDETEATAKGVMDVHVRWHGAPLVLKVDNGSAWRSADFKRWAREHEIALLYSPPRTPSYNGSIEAGIGSMTVHALWSSIRAGRPGALTCEDVLAAVDRMNEHTRPWGWRGPTPREVWCERERITQEERDRFRLAVERYCRAERVDRGIAESAVLDHWEQSTIERRAITRALVEQGYLTIRRRRIALPIRRRKPDRIM